jgi:hypothetical protein
MLGVLVVVFGSFAGLMYLNVRNLPTPCSLALPYRFSKKGVNFSSVGQIVSRKVVKKASESCSTQHAFTNVGLNSPQSSDEVDQKADGVVIALVERYPGGRLV